MIRVIVGLTGLILIAVASGVGIGILLTGWVASDWPTYDVDETDEAGA